MALIQRAKASPATTDIRFQSASARLVTVHATNLKFKAATQAAAAAAIVEIEKYAPDLKPFLSSKVVQIHVLPSLSTVYGQANPKLDLVSREEVLRTTAAFTWTFQGRDGAPKSLMFVRSDYDQLETLIENIAHEAAHVRADQKSLRENRPSSAVEREKPVYLATIKLLGTILAGWQKERRPLPKILALRSRRSAQVHALQALLKRTSIAGNSGP